jgi:hypothetical protein
MLKGPDGHMVYVENNAGEKMLQAIIRDAEICKPKEQQKNLGAGTVCVYAVAHEPGKVYKPYIISDKDGILQTHEVARDGNVDHNIAKVAASIPLEGKARIIYDAPNLGTLHGVMLKGEAAHLIKSNFLKLVMKTNAENMYDIPVKVTEEVSAALMLNNPVGHISIAKLKNGILGYRKREVDGGKTFIFVCNSDDFFDEEPTKNIKDSTLQLFKMTYANKKKLGPRVSIEITGNEYDKPPCKYNTPLIHLGMTVQDVLNVIEYACRHALLDHTGCSQFRTHRLQYENMMRGRENATDSESDSDSDHDEVADLLREYKRWAEGRTLG